MEVAYDRSSLVRVAGAGVLLLLAAVALVVLDEGPGVSAPLWLRAPLARLAALLGTWFLVAVASCLRSDDPAIRIDASGVLFHVNPGRRLVLRHDEITGVEEVAEVRRGPHRAIIGDRLLRVATTREEGCWASTIVVGSRFVTGDLDVIRDQWCAALAGDRDGPRGATP